MEENIKTNQSSIFQPTSDAPRPEGTSLPQRLKNIKVIAAAIIVVFVVSLGLLAIFLLKQNTNSKNPPPSSEELTEEEKVLVEQNERLAGFYGRDRIDIDEQELISARKKILEYAEKHQITVTDEEIQVRRLELISINGQEAIDKMLVGYGWTGDDWEEVLRWKILREKILMKIEPTRFGETLSLRWDVYSPVLNDEVAQKRKGPVLEYLNQIRDKLKNKEIKDFYEVSENFEINKEPIFNGLENNYAMQYSGWDPVKQEYKQFLLTPGVSNYDIVMSALPSSTSEVNCTMGGCQIYNITSGSNGAPEDIEILELFSELDIPF